MTATHRGDASLQIEHLEASWLSSTALPADLTNELLPSQRSGRWRSSEHTDLEPQAAFQRDDRSALDVADWIDSATTSEVLLLPSQSWAAPTSAATAPPSMDEMYYFSAELLAELAERAKAEDRDELTAEQSAEAVDVVLQRAGRYGFLVLYDSLGRLSAASACVLMNALGRTKEPLVRKYRALLIRQALKHKSAAVRDSAALAVYDGKIREMIPFLRAAMEVEPLPHVRRSISDILGVLGA